MKFRVIKIISDREILVNAGSNQGIKEGAVLKILGKDEEIIDPFSHESLGHLPVTKAQVKADIVYEKMCICKPTLVFKLDICRLNVDMSFLNNDTEDNVIRIGDVVINE